MDTNYSYDNLNRITDIDYPAKNLALPLTTRPQVHHNYDIASRLTSLTVDGAIHASNIAYNAASQTTSLNVGASGSNQIIESYNYDQQTGLLAGQTVARSATPTSYLLDLAYDYTGGNGKRTGQLTKILNNLNHNKDRNYTYDALGRLVQAKGGSHTTPHWTQTYTYDRYGNRTSVSASGNSASLRKGATDLQPVTAANTAAPSIADDSIVTDPKVVLPTDQSLLRINVPRSGSSHHASRTTSTTPQGPPVFTDPDLLAPGVLIRALHITQLRTAINDLRARRGFSAYSWQTSVTGMVTANPILEMRTALDQVLGPPPSPGYSAGLAQFQPILAIHIQELRDRVVANWNGSVQITLDGHSNLSYDAATNRITTAGFEYDAAGNQVRALIGGSSNSRRFQYDAANRLVTVKTDNNQVIASYTYGNSNERLIQDEAGVRTYYACDGSTEYTETGSSTTPLWSKTYIYLGTRLLSTLTPNGSGQLVQYHHPDRLGTRLVTNAQDTNSFEQVTLPFGTALAAESSGETNRRFTTYDRNVNTGLDYALNRHYDPYQGRFTQVDPIGMNSTSLSSPQTLNLFAYCTNDPINHTDPSGLGFFGWLKNVFKKIWNAIKAAVAAFVVAFVGSGGNFKKARRAAVRAFVSDFGFRVRTARPIGTPPTFGTGGPALHEIFQGTILAGLFPSPQSYLRWVNGWAEGSLTNQAPKSGRTVCDEMAVDAQRIAGETSADYPNAQPAWALQEFNKRFGMFTYGSYFADTTFGVLGNHNQSSVRTVEVMGTRSYQGHSGFFYKYIDSLNPEEDQVHHFGAFFSAGIANHSFFPYLHRRGDARAQNWGDVALGDQAQALGRYLRANPTQLSNIGELIRNSICRGQPIPK